MKKKVKKEKKKQMKDLIHRHCHYHIANENED